ncbi:MAG: DapH/DapD/GlmU-related protein [Methylotenera sp.]|nr:DapH/DapD/GlmU-related protein [Methylotenera sp.]
MIKFFRIYAWLNTWHIPVLPRLLYALNRIVFSVVLPPTVQVGKNVTFAYQGLATVVHARTRIGANVYIGPNVIIGGRSGHNEVPVIGDDVFIGAGARILGPITIGTGATVGAGSVVLHHVSNGCTVVGSPAREIASSHSTRHRTQH